MSTLGHQHAPESSSGRAQVFEMLRVDYGLDLERGGVINTVARHIDARAAALLIDEDELAQRAIADVDGERARLIHAATVRHSWFNRDPAQLERLCAQLQTRHEESPERTLNLWIAGCATGEEAWTVAMMTDDLGLPARVLATDVDARAVASASAARYGAWTLRELPEQLWRYLEPSPGGREATWTVVDRLRERVEFAVHNLCDPAPAGPFDVVCCRNVLIYFHPERARSVVASLREQLRPGGQLVLGAGDLMFHVDDLPRGQPLLRPIGERARELRARGELGGPAPGIALPRGHNAMNAMNGTTARIDKLRTPSSFGPRPRARPKLGHEPAPAPNLIASDSRLPTPPAPTPSADPSPNAAQTQARLAQVANAVEAGEHERALEIVGSLTERDPLLVEAHLWAGIAHYTLGRDRDAGEALRRARCLAPQLWPAILFAALTNERRGRWDAALRCWIDLQRIIEMPEAPRIVGTDALLEALPRWRGEALALARQRISKHPPGPGGRTP